MLVVLLLRCIATDNAMSLLLLLRPLQPPARKTTPPPSPLSQWRVYLGLLTVWGLTRLKYTLTTMTNMI